MSNGKIQKIYEVEEEYQIEEAPNGPFRYKTQHVEAKNEDEAMKIAKKNGYNKLSTYRLVKTKYLILK